MPISKISEKILSETNFLDSDSDKFVTELLNDWYHVTIINDGCD